MNSPSIASFSSLHIAEASNNSLQAGTYFLCSDFSEGRPVKRRWNLYHESVLRSHGLSIGDFPKTKMDDEELSHYKYLGYLPIGKDDGKYFENSADPVLFRLWLGSLVRGKGIEFGAGANPFPVHLSAHTIFADRFCAEALAENAYPGQELWSLVNPHLMLDMSDMRLLGANSFDYAVACHVIEHLTSPIQAIVGSYRILVKGGALLLVIPSRDRTFDCKRPLTSLQHLIDDYEDYSHEKDLLHYEEWFSIVHSINDNLLTVAEKAWIEHADIHFHTWTAETFEAMAKYVCKSYAPFSKIKIFPEVNSSAIEFYALLTK